MQRIFIVGCPRSGTTLLQSVLAAHHDVFSLPETAFFCSVRPSRWVFRRLGLVSRLARRILVRIALDHGRSDLLKTCLVVSGEGPLPVVRSAT